MLKSGFYKLENTILLYGPANIYGPDYILDRNLYEKYEYPIYGWYWFEDESLARNYFKLQPPEPEPEPEESVIDFIFGFIDFITNLDNFVFIKN